MLGSIPVTSDSSVRQAGPLSEALRSGRIPGLDFLRALAVFAVLVDHSELIANNVFNGAIGVEIFFVISGFLITWLLLGEAQTRGGIHLRAFYQRRIARLMPIFYAYVAIGILMLTVAHKAIAWGAVVSSLAYVTNYYQGLTGAPTHFLSHCWSLAVEEQFYFLWPVTLIWLLRAGYRLDKTIMVMIAGIWIYRASLQLLGWASDEYLYRALETRADHLLIGCLLAVLLKREAYRAWFEGVAAKFPWAPLALLAVLAISGSFVHVLNYRYTLGYIVEPVTAALMLPLLVIHAQKNADAVAGLLNAPLIIKIGQASYGIYLFHQLLLHSLQTRFAAWTGSPIGGFLIAVVVLSFLAHLSYTYFEMPIRQRLNYKR